MSAWQNNYHDPSSSDWLEYTVHDAVAQVWWQNIAIANTAGYPILSEGVPTWFALTKSRLSSKATQQLLASIKNDYLLARTKESGVEKNALALTHQPYAKSKSQLIVYEVSQLIDNEQFSNVINDTLAHYRVQSASQPISHNTCT